jgi:hypothetical protein
MSLKPFDVGLDRALKALRLHFLGCIAILSGLKLRPRRQTPGAASGQPARPAIGRLTRSYCFRCHRTGETIWRRQRRGFAHSKALSANPERQRAALADLASKAIDSLTVGTAESDAKASRKRRLLKGPEEFRDVRVDRSTAKRK